MVLFYCVLLGQMEAIGLLEVLFFSFFFKLNYLENLVKKKRKEKRERGKIQRQRRKERKRKEV